MRLATWNVNSLRARLDKVTWWLDRARPDVLLMQETKLDDAGVPALAFRAAGYEVAHHGQGRWNGVAIASRVGIEDVVAGFPGAGPGARVAAGEEDEADPLAEARFIAARCGGVRVASLYAPNGRALDSPHYPRKLAWYARLLRWLREEARPDEPLLLGGDMNVAPSDEDVWDPRAFLGATHVSAPERAAFAALLDWGLVDAYRAVWPEAPRYTWWDYRAGDFHMGRGMRIDHLLVTRPLAARVAGAEIDREARKGKPTPSDHAPLFVDLDAPGHPIDAGWDGAEKRVAARRSRP